MVSFCVVRVVSYSIFLVRLMISSLTCLFYMNTNKQHEQGKRLDQGHAKE
jgi:hypothetical protein